MKPIDLLGFLAGGLVVFSLVPQVIKTWKTKLTRDLSLPRYVMYTAGLCLWIIYGTIIGNVPLAVTNGVGFCLALSILYLKVRYK